MINVRLINIKEVRLMQEMMKEQYSNQLNGVFYRGSKNKIYLATQHTQLIDLRKVNAEGVGLYVGRLNDDGFRPSIEGVQLINPKKNVFELNDEQLWDWLRGYNIKIDTDYEGYCALSYKDEILGPGKITNKNLWNYIPKERRIKTLIKK